MGLLGGSKMESRGGHFIFKEELGRYKCKECENEIPLRNYSFSLEKGRIDFTFCNFNHEIVLGIFAFFRSYNL